MAQENQVSSIEAKPVLTPPPFGIATAKTKKRYLNMLLYGDFGVGKTYLACTSTFVSSMQDSLLLSAEAGDLSVEDFDGLDIASITTYNQFARAYEFLRAHCNYRDAGNYEALAKAEIWFKGLDIPRLDPEEEEARLEARTAVLEQPRLYHTVIIDSLTEVQKYCMYQLLGIKVGLQALDLEPDNPQFAEWGKSAEMIRLLVRTFRNLPMNVIFVCSKQESQDDRKRIHVKPALPGKLADEVQGFFDVVGYYVAAAVEGGELQRRLYLTPGQTYQAKHRFRHFKGLYLQDPTMQDIINLNQPPKADDKK